MYYIVVASIPDKLYKDIGDKALLLIDQKTLLYHQIHSLLTITQNAKILLCCKKEHELIFSRAIKTKKINLLPYDYNEYSNFGECIIQAIKHIPNNESFCIISLSSIIDPSLPPLAAERISICISFPLMSRMVFSARKPQS